MESSKIFLKTILIYNDKYPANPLLKLQSIYNIKLMGIYTK